MAELTPETMDASQIAKFDAILETLKRSRGFDFTGYKRTSLVRRVLRRMQTIECEGFADYLDYLEVHPDEFGFLFNTILINVTTFFRDAPTWAYLAEQVLPRLLESKSAHEPIRIWSAGCASGEEPYTIAILLAEALGMDEYRNRVKIYATDADEEALDEARQAIYAAKKVATVPDELVARYFEPAGTRYVVNKDLRRSVIFGRHDLMRDAPISRVDLLICRNTLMYFNAEVQSRIIMRFHFALNNGGVLFLGKAEMLSAHAALFTPFDVQRRIFVKIPKNTLRERLLLLSQSEDGGEPGIFTDHTRLRDSVFEVGPVAQIIIDISGTVVQVNERARSLFRLTSLDVGRPLQDLEISYRPVDLRSLLDQAYSERRSVSAKDIKWKTLADGTRFIDAAVVPLIDIDKAMLGAAVTFTDVTRFRQLQDELQEATRDLEVAYEELQSTNEELETTNEELQSANEELETTNEELQSTNEELETINEELQATNEELQATNEELRDRSGELNQVNSFLEAIFASLRSGVIVLNHDLQVQIWNRRAEDLWGLRMDEVQGQHFLNLDIGLPVDQLRASIRACLSTPDEHHEIYLNAVNRRGRPIRCRVVCSSLKIRENAQPDVLLVMEAVESSGNYLAALEDGVGQARA